jgi:hypothetical protein
VLSREKETQDLRIAVDPKRDPELHMDAGHAFGFRIYAIKEKCQRIHAYGRMEE